MAIPSTTSRGQIDASPCAAEDEGVRGGRSDRGRGHLVILSQRRVTTVGCSDAESADRLAPVRDLWESVRRASRSVAYKRPDDHRNCSRSVLTRRKGEGSFRSGKHRSNALLQRGGGLPRIRHRSRPSRPGARSSDRAVGVHGPPTTTSRPTEECASA